MAGLVLIESILFQFRSLGVSCRFENKRKKGEEKKNSEDDGDW
jgi:hypothetical protein